MISAKNGVKVSAIISAYNCASYVEDALISVLAQTRPVDEIIVVDDGSTDDTAARVAKFADHGVRYIYQENRGSGAARNRGVEAASGDVFAFLDCDDLWLPRKTEVQLQYLKAHPEAALVGGDSWWWAVEEDTWSLKRRGGVMTRRAAEEILVRNFVGNPSATLIPRWALEQVGLFDESLRWGVDWELWMRLIPRLPFGFVDQTVLIYRWHHGNVSHEAIWTRFDHLLNMACRYIRFHRPAWKRPLLMARVRAKDALARAWHLRAEGAPRAQQFAYGALALLYAPWEDLGAKLRLLAASVLGADAMRRPRRGGLSAHRETGRPDLRSLLAPPPGYRYSFMPEGE